MSNQTLIQGLNEDLSGELGTIIRYTYQSGKSTGPVGEEIREIFRTELQDEITHAAYLTDVITDLGGEPVTVPQEFDKPQTLKEMLEVDVRMEEEDVERYKKHALIADELGKIDIKVQLEEIAADEGRHARNIRRILKGL